MYCLIVKSIVALTLVAQSSCQISESADTQRGKVSSRAVESQEVSAKPIKLFPVDQGSLDPSFAEFRKQLLRAVRDHDTQFVISILDRNIINGSDTERGVKQFRVQWQLVQPETRLWETLAVVLNMGGSFRGDGNKEFCAPYVTSEWLSVADQLPAGADPLDYEAIIAKDVAMKAEPNSGAATVMILSYDVVKVISATPSSKTTPSWVKITTLAGQEGFVPAIYLRGPSDYHACFNKVGQKWFMTALAAME